MYGLINLNDEIMVNINGLGLVPYISLYPELYELYLERLKLNSDYLLEVIKGLHKKPNKANIYLKKIDDLNNQIKYKTLEQGLKIKIPVQIIGEIDDKYIIKNLITNSTLYIDKKSFKSQIISEIEAKKEAMTLKKNNRKKVK